MYLASDPAECQGPWASCLNTIDIKSLTNSSRVTSFFYFDQCDRVEKKTKAKGLDVLLVHRYATLHIHDASFLADISQAYSVTKAKK